MSNQQGAVKDGSFIAVSSSPDFCRTPPTNTPIPYTVTATLDEALSVSPDVKHRGIPVVLAGESTIAHVTGDEAGTGGGVKSGCNQGGVAFEEGARRVKANGKWIVRDRDKVQMNDANVGGFVLCTAGTEPACGITGDGLPEQDSNPPFSAEPQPPETVEIKEPDPREAVRDHAIEAKAGMFWNKG